MMHMKHFIAVCMLITASLGAQAASDDDMWQVLQKAAVAARALSYQGIFVCQSGKQSKSVQITHMFTDKGEFSRNVLLDGTPRQLLSQGNDLVIYNQKNEKVVIEKRHGQNMFPAVLPTNLDSIRANYALHSGESERIADRQAQIYLLESKDGLRYSYKLWVDSEYGLLLKSVLLNSHNEVIESIAFNQIGLIHVAGLDWFRPKIDSKKNYVMEDEVTTSADTGVANAWSIKELPAGYRKVDQMIRMVHGKTLPVTHVVFSDGMAYVSLFIEPANLKSKASTKATQAVVGNTSYYMNVTDGYQVTVVGEVPEITAAQIGNAVIFNK